MTIFFSTPPHSPLLEGGITRNQNQSKTPPFLRMRDIDRGSENNSASASPLRAWRTGRVPCSQWMRQPMIMDWKLKIENFANLINGTFLVGVVHPLNNTLEVIAAPSIIGDTWTKLLLFFLEYQLNRLALLVVDSARSNYTALLHLPIPSLHSHNFRTNYAEYFFLFLTNIVKMLSPFLCMEGSACQTFLHYDSNCKLHGFFLQPSK